MNFDTLETQFLKLTQDAAFTAHYAEIDVADIVFDAELRKACEANTCGAYGKNYMCPPACGEINELIEKAKGYHRAFVYQTIYPLEDSFDFEGMTEAARVHDEVSQGMCQAARQADPGCLMLGAGGCSICKRCAMLDEEPCRFPEKAFPSVESYGIYVSKLAEACGMKYINGANTVTYFGAVLYNPAC